MDQAATETAKLLGAGNAQMILAVGLVASWMLFGGVLAVVWRRGNTLEAKCDVLHEARRIDAERCGEKYIDILVKNLETNNRMADGMEAFERVVDKVKPT